MARLQASPTDSPGRSKKDVEADEIIAQNHEEWIKTIKRLIPAAVLVPLVVRGDGLNVMLTKRTSHLKHHPGQISFPGGRVDDNDRDAHHTALRETEEEVGLHSRHIEIVGELEEYVVGTGYLVSPIIGVIEPPFELTPQEEEVAEIFEVPLDFLIAPDNFELFTHEINGQTRKHFAITWQEHFIWGATAGMLRNLSNRLLAE